MGCGNSGNKPKAVNNNIKTKDSKKKDQIKLVFLGDAGVGKSSIANKYIHDVFKDQYEVTIGGVYFQRDIQLKNNTWITMHIWDTGGQQRYRAMAPLDAAIAVLVYDVSDQKSFESLDYWIKELQEKRQKEGMILAIAGNKCDIPSRVVDQQAARKFAQSRSVQYFQTSAKFGTGVSQLFQTIAQQYSMKKK